jgi:hypothetical protein
VTGESATPPRGAVPDVSRGRGGSPGCARPLRAGRRRRAASVGGGQRSDQ